MNGMNKFDSKKRKYITPAWMTKRIKWKKEHFLMTNFQGHPELFHNFAWNQQKTKAIV